MHIRTFRADEDYDSFAEFCASHGMTAPPLALLPRVGLVVVNKEQGHCPLAFVWVYKDPSSRLAWMGWLTTRPGLSPRRARAVCEFAVERAKEAAHAQTAQVLFTETESVGLLRLYQRAGAQVTHPVNVQVAWRVY